MYWIAAFTEAQMAVAYPACLRRFEQCFAEEQRRIQPLIAAGSTVEAAELVLLTTNGRGDAPDELTRLGDYDLFWCMNDAAKQAFDDYGIRITFVAHGPDDQAPKGLSPKMQQTRQVILA